MVTKNTDEPCEPHFLESLSFKDYEVEDWLRSPTDYCNKYIRGNKNKNCRLTWKQRVQYIVNHALNDVYTIEPEMRTREHIYDCFLRRWNLKPNMFPTYFLYQKVLSEVSSQFITWIENMRDLETPIVLFESFTTSIFNQSVQLSMIFQMIECTKTSYNVRKVFVDEERNVIDGYLHMTAVFCHKAFGKLPDTIETTNLLTGEKRELRISDDYELKEAQNKVYVMLQSMERLRSQNKEHVKEVSQWDCYSTPFSMH